MEAHLIALMVSHQTIEHLEEDQDKIDDLYEQLKDEAEELFGNE